MNTDFFSFPFGPAVAGWLLGVSASVALVACSETTETVSHSPSPPDLVEHADWGEIFERLGGEGTAVVLDVATGRRHVHDSERAARRFAPASTFKIYNSLVALERGAVPDVDQVLPWDGVERMPGWDSDQAMRQAFQRSTVWFYQELARRIGREGYVAAFQREPYGNGEIGDAIDRFWLGEPLAISADEQVAFVDRLRRGAVDFPQPAQEIVRELLLLEAGTFADGQPRRLYGKTGWTWRTDAAAPDRGPGDFAPRSERLDEIGWLVGWLERSRSETADGSAGATSDAWVYALNVTPRREDFPMRTARREVLDAILEDLGLGAVSVESGDRAGEKTSP